MLEQVFLRNTALYVEDVCLNNALGMPELPFAFRRLAWNGGLH